MPKINRKRSNKSKSVDGEAVEVSGKARSYVFTLNNWTDEEYHEIKRLCETAKWAIVGKERGASETPHLQGYIQFRNPRAFTAVKKVMPRAHIERAEGKWDDSLEYCSKDWDFEEFGERPKDGGAMEKERWQKAWDAAKRGDIESVDADIRVRCYATLRKIQKDYQVIPPDMDNLDFWWFWGKSGTGKSRTARAENPYYYVKNLNKWWDGYVDQPCVIIEEMNPDAAKYLGNYLKMWCDHYAFSAETKGGSMTIRPPKIVITSNYTMHDCFGHDLAGLYEPLERRFNVREFN